MEILLSFGLEIVVGLLLGVVFLQHRRIGRIQRKAEQNSNAMARSMLELVEYLKHSNVNYDERFINLIQWIRRVESEAQTKEDEDEDESGVQLLQEGSKKVH